MKLLLVLVSTVALLGCGAEQGSGVGGGGTGRGTPIDDDHLQTEPGSEGVTCATACDCADGLACTNGKCSTSGTAFHCCSLDGCPAGTACQGEDGVFGTCTGSGGGNTGGNTGGTADMSVASKPDLSTGGDTTPPDLSTPTTDPTAGLLCLALLVDCTTDADCTPYGLFGCTYCNPLLAVCD